MMYENGWGFDKIIQQQWNGITKQRSKAVLIMLGWGVDKNISTAVIP